MNKDENSREDFEERNFGVESKQLFKKSYRSVK